MEITVFAIIKVDKAFCGNERLWTRLVRGQVSIGMTVLKLLTAPVPFLFGACGLRVQSLYKDRDGKPNASLRFCTTTSSTSGMLQVAGK
jgi:hypothetical protein